MCKKCKKRDQLDYGAKTLELVKLIDENPEISHDLFSQHLTKLEVNPFKK
ncbi:MAG: hypothetical protein ACJAT1_000184 [Marivirga sp.]|jgi:hypothetical protein